MRYRIMFCIVLGFGVKTLFAYPYSYYVEPEAQSDNATTTYTDKVTLTVPADFN